MDKVPISQVADLRGKPVEFYSEPGAQHFVLNALHGRDYPPVYPDVFHPHTILDVGSHVGAASLFFRHVYPDARIWCFEPNPTTFELLKRNVSGEACIQIRQVALGERNGEMQLFSGVYSSLQASLVPNEENRDVGPVISIRRVDEMLEEIGITSISILKVDTEGMEIPILVTLGDRLAGIDVIYLEYHSEHDRREIDRMLAEHFVLYSSQADMPDRGTVCYAARDRLAEWRKRSSRPRLAFPKGDQQ